MREIELTVLRTIQRELRNTQPFSQRASLITQTPSSSLQHSDVTDVSHEKFCWGVIMKNLSRFLVLFGLILTLSAFTARSASTVEGIWIGEYTGIDHSEPFKVHFWQHDGTLRGTISLSDAGSKELPLSWVMIEASRVHFELVRSSGTLVFDGVLRDGMISGDLLYSNLRGTFQLAPDNLSVL